MSAGLLVTRKVRHLAIFKRERNDSWGDWTPLCKRQRGESARLLFADSAERIEATPEQDRTEWEVDYLKFADRAATLPPCKACSEVLAALNEYRAVTP